MSRYKDDRRLKKDTKAEDDPFKLLGLQQGASASQVRPRNATSITSLRRLHSACFSLFLLAPLLTTAQVKAAYKKLSLQLHPDKNPDCKDCAAKFSKARFLSTSLIFQQVLIEFYRKLTLFLPRDYFALRDYSLTQGTGC